MNTYNADGEHLFLDLTKDVELFQGEGEYQFDIYRMMKEKNGSALIYMYIYISLDVILYVYLI